MENFEFKSAICTSVEQSRRLLELGLKKETADMMYITDVNVPEEHRYYDLVPECYEPCLEGIVGIPAWSLHRLIEIASNVQKIPISFVNWIHSDVRSDYDYLIDVIQWLIECGYINEFCLEEK